MEERVERNFHVGDIIHVVDYWGTNDGSQAFEATATILKVNEEGRVFSALLYGDTCQTYSFNDFGRLVFDNYDDAEAAANALPRPKTMVFQRIGDRVYKKHVTGINGKYNEKTYDLFVCLDKGNPVSIKEIGYSLFLTEEEARN